MLNLRPEQLIRSTHQRTLSVVNSCWGCLGDEQRMKNKSTEFRFLGLPLFDLFLRVFIILFYTKQKVFIA